MVLKSLRILLLFLFAYSLFPNNLSAAETYGKDCRHSPKSFTCVSYIDNYDGDTITVDIPRVHHFFGSSASIRVNGIDAAEMNSDDPCERDMAKKAADMTAKLLYKAERVDLLNIERGKYFRIVADVYFDGKNLADELLKRKLAVKYKGGSHQPVNWCHFQ